MTWKVSKNQNQAETLETKSSVSQVNTVERHSRRLEEVEDRLSGLKDKMNIRINKRILREKMEWLWMEYTGIMWLHQKTKSVNHGPERMRRGSRQRYRKHDQQYNSRKLPESQERDAHPCIGSLYATKQTWPK
jgi:hypothetical protein